MIEKASATQRVSHPKPLPEITISSLFPAGYNADGDIVDSEWPLHFRKDHVLISPAYLKGTEIESTEVRDQIIMR